jgi:hypothetical protein
MFSDGDNVGACYFGDCDTAVCFIGSIEVDVVRTDTCCYGNLELLSLSEAFLGEVTWVEALHC